MRPLLSLVLASVAGCGGAEMRVKDGPPAYEYLVDFEGKPSNADLGHVRLKPEVCQGLSTAPVGKPLEPDDFIAFLKAQNVEPRVTRARVDLVFVDVASAGTEEPVRFRIASTTSAGAAGRELHTALLQRGPGTWGLHRSNLAVLAPPAHPDDAVVVASKLRLPCWGVLMIAGQDDTYVVPGGYTEL
ncbi:MAG: hypothetical protein KF837_28995 [Labilithrix sp.]|nr:hypothetical protein [Labilithrix sp.]